MIEPAYIYNARVNRIIDGDTFVADIDLGFYVTAAIKVRIHGVNAPEHSALGGPEATDYLNLIIGDKPLLIQSYHDRRSFERWVCDVYAAKSANFDGPFNVAQAIIENGHGVPFMATHHEET